MLSRKKMHFGVLKAHASSRIGYAIDGIRRESGDYNDWNSPLKINAFMHKVMLSGLRIFDAHKDYEKLWNVFNGLYVDNSFVPENRMPCYNTRWIKQYPEFQINVYVYPIKNRPPYMIEIIPREHASIDDWRNLLQDMCLSFPKIKVSTVDYAIDEHCYDFRAVEKLYRIQLKHLYIPYQRKAFIFGGDLVQYGNRTRMNSVCRIKNVKIYERGPDHKKKDKSWIMEDVDRVRLEYSAPRSILVNHGISTLADLVRHPKFYEINKNKYKFKQFKGSNILPKLGQDYTKSDKNGNIGCFQLEVIGHRGNITNIGHYLKGIKEFEDLTSELRNAMQRFDSEW